MKRSGKYFLLKNVIAFCIIILISFFVEIVGFHFDLIRSGAMHDGTIAVPLDSLSGSGFHIEGNALKATGDDGAKIQVPLTAAGYVNKLEYGYQAQSGFQERVVVDTVNGFGNEQSVVIENKSHPLLKRSVMNIQSYADSLVLELPEGVTVTYLQLNNGLVFNVLRFFFVFVVLVLIYSVVIFREYLARKIEVGFLVLSFAFGSFIILSLQTSFASWDEQIHFNSVYTTSTLGSTVEYTQTADEVVNLTGPIVSAPLAGSLEESQDIRNYFDAHHDYNSIVLSLPKSLFLHTNELAYLPGNLFYRAAEMLNLPFSAAFCLGKFGNLLMYCLIVFFAIRMIPVGKRIMTAIALMPTPVLLASSYSYDPMITACTMLGIAVIFAELAQPDKPFSMKNAIVFTVAMLLASFPKAVYIPLILLALLLPKQKFASKRNRYLFKGGILLLFLLMMGTFVLPALSGGLSSGDPRGGDTSPSGQILSMLTHLFTTVQLYFNNIVGTLGEKFLGMNSLGDFAYAGLIQDYNLVLLIVGLILFTVFTDTNGAENAGEKFLGKQQKITLFVLTVVVSLLIWTAMYLSFTPVGRMEIAGVQGRYFIPLMLPLFFVIRTPLIQCKIKTAAYNAVVLSVSTLILTVGIYQNFIARIAV